MDKTFWLNFIQLLSTTLQILIFIRVILSWLMPQPTGGWGKFLMEVTDPILIPFQRILPPMAGIDFSPILALVTLQILQNIAQNLLI